MLWQSWLAYQNPEVLTPTPQTQAQALPPIETTRTDDMPTAVSQPPTATPVAALEQQTPQSLFQHPSVRVETDTLIMDISTQGGEVQAVYLRQIAETAKPDSAPFQLLEKNSDGSVYVMQSGLLHDRIPELANASARAPSHHAQYQAEKKQYSMPADEDLLRVPLRWQGPEVTVEKVYIFHRGKHLVELEHRIANHGELTWIGRQYAQLRHSELVDQGGNQFIYTYTGATYYDGTYQKIDFDEMTETSLSQSISDGWAAMIQHYFVSALVPLPQQEHDYYTKVVAGERGNEYLIGLRSQPLMIAGNSQGQFKTRLYVGPKYQSELEQIAPGLELTVDYGIFTVISKPLFWVLGKAHSVFKNWGWAIVIVTLLIKLVFYKLSEASYRSMAKMRKFQPQLTALRERCGDDRQRMNQEMMALYKKEKVNPLGGCLPILVQIPVFIALYWVLIESVELRHAPFILWITDLSSKDPFFVLPVLMGITMLIQNHLNPTPPDPIQAKVMMMLPLIFTVFFAFFPAGLVLYWLVNNLLSISQQWVITKRIEQEN